MEVAELSVGEAIHWAGSIDRRLAIVLLEPREGRTATRSTILAHPASEAIAKFAVAMSAAEKDMLVPGQ